MKALKFTKINQDQFDDIVVEAGLILKNFNPASPTVTDSDIVCPTTGGITAVCNASFEDFGSDIDNCPENSKELKYITGYDCSLAFTSVKTSETDIKLALGAADIDSSTHKVTPRSYLKSEDFSDLWWVSDKVGGGFVAVKLKNALSTGGFSLKTSKKGKGNLAITVTGHASVSSPTDVPMEFYSFAAATESNSASSTTPSTDGE